MRALPPTSFSQQLTFSERHRFVGTFLVLVLLVALGATTGGLIGSLLAQLIDAVLDHPAFTNAGR